MNEKAMRCFTFHNTLFVWVIRSAAAMSAQGQQGAGAGALNSAALTTYKTDRGFLISPWKVSSVISFHAAVQ